MLEIFENIAEVKKDIHFVIVGKAKDLKYQRLFDERIMVSPYRKRIRYIPKLTQNQLSTLYEQATIFILCSSYEIYGMVLLEAMYFGLPVISSVTAGSKQLIVNGETGLILSHKDVKRWSTAISILLYDDQRLRNFSEASKRRVQEYFLWEKAVDNFYAIYQSVVDHSN